MKLTKLIYSALTVAVIALVGCDTPSSDEPNSNVPVITLDSYTMEVPYEVDDTR